MSEVIMAVLVLVTLFLAFNYEKLTAICSNATGEENTSSPRGAPNEVAEARSTGA